MRSRRARWVIVARGDGDEDEKKHEHTDEPGKKHEQPPQPPPMIQDPPAPDANPIDPRTFWRL